MITVDGPAGAGKSTVAQALADRLGFIYLDTGAIYRTVAFEAKRKGIDWSDETAVAALARDIVARRRLEFRRDIGGRQQVILDGVGVSESIRRAEISTGASVVSAHPSVRQELLVLQREIATTGAVIMEGRDTGTVVYPQADVKFFMTASPEERALRRFEELKGKGMSVDLAQTLIEIRQRDERDTQRAAAPLRRADDAIEIETTGVPFEDVVRGMLERIEARTRS